MKRTTQLFWFPLLLAFYEMAGYLSSDAFLPAMPLISRDLVTSDSMVQLTLTAWFAGGMIFQFLLGPLADRYGRRPVMFVGATFFFLSTFCCAIAPGIGTMIFFRFIQGAAVNSLIVAGYTTIHELYDQKRAARTLAYIASITVLSPALGPLAGSFIMHWLSWRWIFGVLFLWSCIAIPPLYWAMPETLMPEDKKPICWPDVCKSYFSVLRHKGFVLRLLTLNFIFATLIAWIAAGSFLSIDIFHYSTFEYSFMQVAIFGMFIVGNQLASLLLVRYSLQRISDFGLYIVLAGGVLLLLGGIVLSHSLLWCVVVLSVTAFGSGLAWPVLSRLLVEEGDAPMSVKIVMQSVVLGGAGVLGSVMVSVLHGSAITGFVIILFGFCVCAFISNVLVKKIDMVVD